MRVILDGRFRMVWLSPWGLCFYLAVACGGADEGGGGLPAHTGGSAQQGGSRGVAQDGGAPTSGGGGQAVSGGSSTGGANGSGGTRASGGAATGGSSASGGLRSIGGSASGGQATGGLAVGGVTGGARSSGGAMTGGSSAGGTSTGGTAAGGVFAGGSSSGGTATGGSTAGGSASGGKSTGGTATGGTATGGIGTGGLATGGAGTSQGGTTTNTGGSGTTTGGVSATGGTSSCLTPPAADPVVGWASVNGMNQNGTTGGGNATPQVVATPSAFQSAVSGTTPAVVYLNAVLAPASVAIGSNKTIVGVCGAEFHGHLGLSGSVNVIVRNLKIVGYAVGDCTKDPKFDAAVGCSSGADAVSISSASHHVWFDHCDVSDGTDGNLDTNAGSDYITISWTKFHYTPRTDNVGNDSTGASGHRFSNLVGSGDAVAEDVGHLNMTWHHNWWAENVDQRMPRTRRGKIHVVNNLYTSTGNSYCTNSGFETHLLVENNIYIGVKNPLSPDANGDMLARNNVFTNTSGTTTANGTGFTPPYTYTPEATGALEQAIRNGAGPH